MPLAGSNPYPAGDEVGLLTALLPRQGADYGRPYSLNVDQQFRAVLAKGLDLGVGRGLVTGGTLVVGTGLQVVLQAASTALFFGGLGWTLDADLLFNSITDNDTTYVWAA